MGKTINIDGFEVGGEQTYVIAEIGSNYNQSWDLALESIDAALESGANAVKFQSLNVHKLYQNPSDEIVALHKKIDLAEEWHQTLNDYCKKKGITFFSSPTYLEAVDLLEEIDVPLYKLASAQVGTFPQLIRKVAQQQKPTILSSGIVTQDQLDGVIDIFKQEGNDQYIVLHCNSMYPTPYGDVQLGRINQFQERYNCIVGYSDHSDGVYTAIAAVAKGAKVIEKHFAVDRSLPVPDAPFSLEPADFKQMVEGIRIAEKASGNKDRSELESDEATFKSKILYRLYLKADKKAGETISEDDCNYLRNPSGIDCRDFGKIADKKLKEDTAAGTLLTFEHFE